MPLYYFKCEGCRTDTRRILKVEEVAGQKCSACSNLLKRDPRPPTSQATETLDSGVMTKRLERLVDAERLYQDRYDKIEKKQSGED